MKLIASTVVVVIAMLASNCAQAYPQYSDYNPSHSVPQHNPHMATAGYTSGNYSQPVATHSPQFPDSNPKPISSTGRG